MLQCYSVRISQRVLEQISIEKLFYNLRNENDLHQWRVTSVSISQLKPNSDLTIQLPLCFKFNLSSVLMEGDGIYD